MRNAIIRHDGPEHVIAFAPTRSGKGVGLVVPTLLSWSGGAVIHDIKGENWELTSGWRSTFSKCVRFRSNRSKFGAVQSVIGSTQRSRSEVRDAMNIADILVDPDGPYIRKDHWDKTAYALLVGAILHVLYTEDDKSISRVVSLLSDPSRTFDETVDRIAGTNHVGTPTAPQTHPVIAELTACLSDLAQNREFPGFAPSGSLCFFGVNRTQSTISLSMIIESSRSKSALVLKRNQFPNC